MFKKRYFLKVDSPPRLILSLVLHQVVEDGTVPVKGGIPAEGEAARAQLSHIQAAGRLWRL
jgi:hypothetical protein